MIKKRIVSYIIDILFLSVLVALLSNISFINPYIDKNISLSKEYNEKYNEYLKNDSEEIRNELETINYKLEKTNAIPSAISIVITLLYFSVFQKYNHGQTLGKKIMHIRIEDMSLWKYLIRSIVLYNVIFNGLNIMLIVLTSQKSYMICSTIINILVAVIEIATIVLLINTNGKKGLHDLITKSNVVEEVRVKKNVL